MTSNNSCLYPIYNNENDAFACNNRPIDSALQYDKYGGSFEDAEGSYYDYGNTSHNSDFKISFDRSFQKMPTETNTLGFVSNSLDTRTTSSRHPADIPDTGGGNFGAYVVNYSNDYNGRLSALDNEFSLKKIPNAPMQQSSSFGMYSASGTGGCAGNGLQWQQSFAANQQVTPPVARSRMLPHPAKLSGGVAANEFASYEPQHARFEGPQKYINTVSLQDSGVPQPRILPQPRAPLSKTFSGTCMLNHQHFQDTTNHDTITFTPKYFYDTRTITNDQDSCPNTSESCDINEWEESSGAPYSNSTFDLNNFGPIQYQRPHTSMAPYHTNSDGEYGRRSFADDNLSTHSDTPIALSTTSSPSLSAAAQQKLQQQRKLSLLMAMTTASVVASGETRKAPKKQKHQAKVISPTKKGAQSRKNSKTAKFSDDCSLKYESSSRDSLIVPVSSTVTSNNRNNFDADNIRAATTYTTSRTSELFLATTAKTVEPITKLHNTIVSTISSMPETVPSTTLAVIRPTRARKLPKCLPIIPKTKINADNGNADTVTVIGAVSRNKILPSLPVTPQSNNNLLETYSFVIAQEATTPISICSPSNHSEAIETATSVDTTVSNIAPTTTFSNQNANITNLISLTSSDLSNNNRNDNFLKNSLDVSTSKAYADVEYQTSTPSTCSSNLINYVLNISSSTSQTTTSSIKALSPPTRTYSNFDYLNYLKSYSLTTEEKTTDGESFSSGSNTTTMTSTTSDVLASRRKSVPETNIELTDLTSYVTSTETSIIPETITDYSAYIDSLTTTLASSPTTSLKVINKVSDSLVPLETKTSFSFANASLSYNTYNSYMDLLVTSSSESIKLGDVVTTKTAPIDISLQSTNSHEMKTFSPNNATSQVNENVAQPLEVVSSINNNRNNKIYTESYADYIKKFDLPELPPLLTAKENSENSHASVPILKQIGDFKLDFIGESVIISSKESNEKQEELLKLPCVADFSNNDYNTGNKFLNGFKEENFQNETITKAVLALNSVSDNISIAEETSPFFITNSTTESTTALTAPIVISQTKKETNDNIDFYTEHLQYDKEYEWNFNDGKLAPKTKREISDGDISDAKSMSIENLLIDSSNISTAFDDSFYDSFKVDLDTLTETITFDKQSSIITTITTTATMALPVTTFLQDLSSKSAVSNKSDEPAIPISTVGFQGRYYRPSNTKPVAIISEPAEEISKPVMASLSNSTTSKATSLIGGLSKGLKGSLFDSVLTGGSATTSSQQSQLSKKKSFGFNLASKLVPNVGGLLVGASANKNTTKVTTVPANSSSYGTKVASDVKSVENGNTSVYNERFSIEAHIQQTENNVEGSSFDYQNAEDYCDVDYNNQQKTEYDIGMQITDNTGENIASYDEYSVGIYSEYENCNMASVYAVESGPGIPNDPITTHICSTLASSAVDIKSSMGTHFLSSIANVSEQHHYQKPVFTESKPAGLFGSFLGKAAAAVQSATQAVNQGAASIVQHQKVPATTTTHDPMVTITLNNAYNSQQMDQVQHDSLTSLQTCSSLVTVAGTDYENSNIVAVYNHEVPHSDMNTNNYYSNGNQCQPPTVTTAKMLPTVPAVGKKLPNITNVSKSGIGCLIKQQPTEIYDEDEMAEEYEEQKLPNYIDEDDEHNRYYRDLENTKDSIPKGTHLNGYYEQHHIFNDAAGTSSGGYDYREDYFDEEDEYKYLEREAEAEQERLYRQQRQQQKQSTLEFIEESHEADGDDVEQDEPFNDDNYPSEDSGNYLDESSSGSVSGMAIKTRREISNTANADSMMLPATGQSWSSVTLAQSTIGLHQEIKKQDSIVVEEDENIPHNLIETIIESPVSMIENPNYNQIAKSAFRRKSSDILLDDDLSIDANVNDQLGELPQSIHRKKKILTRSETEEVVSGHMQITKRQKPEVTAKQRWHWAYNKIIIQLDVSNISTFISHP